MRFAYQKLSLKESARFCQKIYICKDSIDEQIAEADNFELEKFREISKNTLSLQPIRDDLDRQRTEENEHKEEANNKNLSLWNQRKNQCFYSILDEECRAYLIDLKVEWLGSRSKNWYTNLEIGTRSLIFILDLYWGLLWSRVKHVNPMRRQRRF